MNSQMYCNEFKEFRFMIEKEPSLCVSKDTFFFKMRYAEQRIRASYNKICNELLAYIDSYDDSAHVTYSLCRGEVVFAFGDTVLASVTFGDKELVLKTAFELESENGRSYKRISENSADGKRGFKSQIAIWRTDSAEKDAKVIGHIRGMMESRGCVKDFEYQFCDYASFFKSGELTVARDNQDVVVTDNVRSIEEDEVLGISFDDYQEYSEPVEVNEQSEILATDDILKTHGIEVDADMNAEPRPVKLVRENDPYDHIKVEKEVKKKTKRKSLWQRLREYGFHFLLFQEVLFYAATIVISVGLGFLFQLEWWATLGVTVGSLLCMPFLVRDYFEKKYEEKRFRDVESYIEQMLYSFRRRGKVISALNDALVVFPSGQMHNQIVRAINYIKESGNKNGSPYEHALSFIEEAYPCRRIRTLHRYIIKVEDNGGNHDIGVDVLVKDRRMWIDRCDKFRKQCAVTLRDVIISVLLSFALAAVVMFMLPQDIVDVTAKPVYQILTMIFAVINIVTVTVVSHKTVVSIKDDDEAKNAEKTIRMVKWLHNYDRKTEEHKSRIKALPMLAIVVVGIVMKNLIIVGIGAAMFLFAFFFMAKMNKKSAVKRVCREVEKVFPDWLLEMALLLQNDNVHVAIEKTASSAPLVLRAEIQKLSDDIKKYPNDYTPYADFFSFLPIESVHSSMRLLYSIAEFGSQQELYQLSELIERNSKLMDQAERYRNDDKIVVTFMFKFIPTLSSSVTMMANMMLFLFSYMVSISV